jgi:hypothetical protein
MVMSEWMKRANSELRLPCLNSTYRDAKMLFVNASDCVRSDGHTVIVERCAHCGEQHKYSFLLVAEQYVTTQFIVRALGEMDLETPQEGA